MEVLQNMQRQMEQEVQEVKRIENGKTNTLNINIYLHFAKLGSIHWLVYNFFFLDFPPKVDFRFVFDLI